MAIKRYATTTPTSGLASYPTTALSPRAFLSLHFDKTDETSYVQVTDETIAANTHSTGLWRLNYVPKGAATDTLDSDTVLEIWSGPSGTGTQFTAIKADEDFGAASARQFRYYLGDDAIDLSYDQITDGSFTTLYATYKASHSKISPEWRARMEQEIAAAQDAIDDLGGGSSGSAATFTATAGENLTQGLGYIDSSFNVMQFDDPTSLSQVNSLVWISTSYSTGETVTCYKSGSVTVPGALADLPAGKRIRAGNSGMPTWDQDASANKLVTGDYVVDIGFASGVNTLQLLISHMPHAAVIP